MYIVRKSTYNKKEVKNMSIYGYARVSTKEQHEDRQVQALLEYGVNEENIFVDKVSRKRF